jgi:hypothetical protein
MGVGFKIEDGETGKTASVDADGQLGVMGSVSITNEDRSRENDVNIDSEVLVKPPSSVYLKEGFLGSSLNTTKWGSTTATGGTATVGSSFLTLSTTTTSGSTASVYTNSEFIHTFSRTLTVNMGLIISSPTVRNNTRIWGMRNTDTDDGIYFKLNNSRLYACHEYNGEVTETDITGYLPLDNFLHRFRIQYRNYRAIFTIDDIEVYEVDQLNEKTRALFEQENLPVYFLNENDAATTAAVDLKIDGVALLNDSNESVGISGVDDDDVVRQVAVTSAGRIKVSQEPAGTPEGATDKSTGEVVLPVKNGGTVDTTYTITNGKTLKLNGWFGGAETPSGSKFEIYYDPNGDGTGMTLLGVQYINYANFNVTLALSFDGDGTAGIRLRATNNTPTSGLEHAQFFSGYEI